ncbi:MAG: IS3 family transposase [Nitrospira sp.]|nr:IS3 family transposase [Nitrospira sp.]
MAHLRFLDTPNSVSLKPAAGQCRKFFRALKREFVYHRRYAIHEAATQEYIEVFCKRRHRHSAIGYDSPAEYEVRTLWLNQVSTELREDHCNVTC